MRVLVRRSDVLKVDTAAEAEPEPAVALELTA